MDDSPIKVLIIEDDEEDFLLTKHYLANIPFKKYHIDWEKEYMPAIQKVLKQEHDIYILDYNLKGDSGIDLIHYIKDQGLNLPFIILTGIDSYKMDMEAMNAGATDYLIKGKINAEILERSIRYAIKQKNIENQLIQSNNTKAKLFSIISHDIQSPFNNMIGALDLIADHSDVDMKVFFTIIKKIKKDFVPSYDLMQNLLFWSRSQLGSIKCVTQNIELLDCILKVEQQLIYQIKQKNINFNINVKRGVKGLIDPIMFELVIRNLLTNAIKFTPRNGSIDISVKEKKNCIEFCIADSGIGMDKETLNNLFRKEIFTSTNGTENEKGSGLGIKLCIEFVEKCNSKFWAESSPGKGSSFYFNIPTQ